MNRRAFTQTVCATLFASQGLAKKHLSLHIGHTGLTWIPLGRPAGGVRPVINPMQDPQYVDAAIRDIAGLSFMGLSTSGTKLKRWRRTAGSVLASEKYNLPLISAYCGTNLSVPEQRKDSISKTLEWAKLARKYNGKVIVVGPDGVKHSAYDFKAHKDDTVTTLNELGKAIMDMGLTPVLRQHTGTCVETREETYAVLEAVDTRVMKFGPDIGQLQKGGSDPCTLSRTFCPWCNNTYTHLKDYVGGPNYLGYCPLGQGKVDIRAILAMMNGRKTAGRVMVELDSPPPQPAPALENAKIGKAYLEKQGVSFRS